MRLLIATHARAAVGGVETYLRGIAPALVARGHVVAVLFEHRFEAAGAAVDDPYRGCAPEWCVADFGEEAALDAARRWGADLVWIHGLESAALEAGLLEVGPTVLFAHNYDGTCATGAKFHRWPHARPCARRMGPACLPLNFTRNCGLPNPAGFANRWRRQRQRSRQLRRYRTIMVASRHMATEFCRHLDAQGADAGRVRRLPYPLFAAPGPRPAERAAPPSQLLMLARLTVAKGGDTLLRALALAQHRLGRTLALTVAGDGPERERLRALGRQLGLAVDLPGWIGPAERAQRLATADLLAVPSLWPEPFGMVGLEAAAAGVPAVAFAVGGITDWLRPGENGELAPGAPPTAAGLAAALQRALGDPAHWQRLRQGAWETAGHYRLDGHLDRLEAILAGTGADADD